MTPSIPNESFQRLVREHHEGVYRTARVLSGSEADALDVTQQVFLRVLDGRLRLAEAEDPARLLRWQAVREARMARRSARRRRRREDRHAMQRPSRTEDEPSARIEEQETRGVLAGLLDALPEDLATALTLRFRASWTYAEIGASLGISEPSAHARVQRALERLRRSLARMGLAGQAVLIPELLAGAPPAPLPAGIEQDLLSLSSTAAVAARSTAALWIAAALTAGLALGTAALGGAFSSRDGRAASDPTSLEAARPAAQRTPPPPPTARDDSPATSPVAGAGRNPVADPAGYAAGQDSAAGLATGLATGPASSAPGDLADLPAAGPASATLAGRVVDGAGAPVEGAAVLAESVQRDGKFARFSAAAASDPRGLFRLELEVAGDDGQDYLLTARTPTSSTRAPVLRVPRAGQAPFQLLVLTPDPGDRPGDFELTVRVEGPGGSPVAGARVRLFDRRAHASGERGFVQPRDGTSGPDGSLRLAGDRLGPKALRVDARGAGFGLRFEELEVERAGPLEHVVRLARALEIRGRLTRVDGRPLDGVDETGWSRLGVVAFHAAEPSDWITASAGPGGEFTLEGLDDRAYTLRASGPGLSSGTLLEVPAGTSDLVIELKAAGDPLERGVHDGELHGRLVDAADGRPVIAEAWSVTYEPLWGDAEPDLVATVLSPRPYQTAAFGSAPPPSDAFHLTGLPTGKYLVVARVRGYAPAWTGPFELERGQLVGDLVLPLERGVEVSGRVLDDRGRPLAGALVVLVGEGEPARRTLLGFDREVREKDGQGAMLFDSARCDERGRFRFRRPVPVRAAVRPAALHPDFEPQLGPRLAPDVGPGLELRLERPRER